MGLFGAASPNDWNIYRGGRWYGTAQTRNQTTAQTLSGGAGDIEGSQTLFNGRLVLQRQRFKTMVAEDLRQRELVPGR